MRHRDCTREPDRAGRVGRKGHSHIMHHRSDTRPGRTPTGESGRAGGAIRAMPQKVAMRVA
eukprot:8894992-Pyramimonas_sp.AAC.1